MQIVFLRQVLSHSVSITMPAKICKKMNKNRKVSTIRHYSALRNFCTFPQDLGAADWRGFGALAGGHEALPTSLGGELRQHKGLGGPKMESISVSENGVHPEMAILINNGFRDLGVLCFQTKQYFSHRWRGLPRVWTYPTIITRGMIEKYCPAQWQANAESELDGSSASLFTLKGKELVSAVAWLIHSWDC